MFTPVADTEHNLYMQTHIFPYIFTYLDNDVGRELAEALYSCQTITALQITNSAHRKTIYCTVYIANIILALVARVAMQQTDEV